LICTVAAAGTACLSTFSSDLCHVLTIPAHSCASFSCDLPLPLWIHRSETAISCSATLALPLLFHNHHLSKTSIYQPPGTKHVPVLGVRMILSSDLMLFTHARRMHELGKKKQPHNNFTDIGYEEHYRTTNG
jgi:hypothetical protein